MSASTPAPAPAPAPAGAPPGRRTTYPRAVTHRDVLVTLGAFLLATVVGTGIGLGGAYVLVRGGADPLAAATGAVPTTVLLWAVALWYALRGRGWTWTDVGLGRGGRAPGRWWWQVPLAYIAIIVTGSLIVSLIQDPGQQANVMAGGLHFGPVALVAIWLSVVVGAPLVEEVLFRRVLLGWLEGRVGFALAAVLQAAVFSVLHVVPAAMVLTFLLGLTGALLARAHGSLWPAVALHGLNNLVATSVLLALLLL